MKINKIFLLAMVAAISIVFVFIFVNVFESTTRKKGDYKIKNVKETITFERSKSFSAIKIIENIDSLKVVDAFGNQLKSGEWYLQSNVTQAVFRMNVKSSDYTDLSWLMNKGKKEFIKARITNGAAFGVYVDSEILILGDKKLVLDDFTISIQ